MSLQACLLIFEKSNVIFTRQLNFSLGYISNHTIANLVENIKK